MRDIQNIKDDQSFQWTVHAKRKLIHYGLSPSKVKSIIRGPKRLEESIVPGIAAAMRPAGSRKHPYEVWAMFQVIEPKSKNLRLNQGKTIKIKPPKKIKIISAWKYPGKTKAGEPVPIPEEVISELGIKAENIIGFGEGQN